MKNSLTPQDVFDDWYQGQSDLEKLKTLDFKAFEDFRWTVMQLRAEGKELPLSIEEKTLWNAKAILRGYTPLFPDVASDPESPVPAAPRSLPFSWDKIKKVAVATSAIAFASLLGANMGTSTNAIAQGGLRMQHPVAPGWQIMVDAMESKMLKVRLQEDFTRHVDILEQTDGFMLHAKPGYKLATQVERGEQTRWRDGYDAVQLISGSPIRILVYKETDGPAWADWGLEVQSLK